MREFRALWLLKRLAIMRKYGKNPKNKERRQSRHNGF